MTPTQMARRGDALYYGNNEGITRRWLCDKVARLESENDEMRKLATGLYRCWQGEDCEGCPMQDDDGWCIRDMQLRKLGIEVDE